VNAVLGGLIDAEETADGLEAEFDFVPDDADSGKAYRRVKGGYITGLSIGYIPVKWDYEQREGGESWDRIRHLKEVKLLEVSLVIWPMNEGARVDPDSVKGLADALKAGALTPEQKAQLRALLDAPPAGTPPAEADPPAPAPKGLAHDDPKRLALEDTLRSITLRRLAA
jgi:HK97 family phage prohead protease